MQTFALRSSSPYTSRLLVATLAVAALGGCNRKPSGAKVAREDMAIVPAEADIAFTINVNRARTAPLWKKLLEARDQDPAAKKQYDDFIKKCQIDPLNQIDSVFLALPSDADASHEYAVILRGTFSGDAVIGCVRTAARDNLKQEVQETEYNGHKLYTAGSPSDMLTVLDNGLAVLGGKAWIRKVVDLHDGRTPGSGAKDHAQLVELLKRTRTNQMVWGAGIVPASVSESLKRNQQLGSAATMKSLFGSLDAQKGLELHVGTDLGSDAAASDLSARIKEQLANGRKDSTVQLLGMSSYFDAIKVAAQKNTLAIDIDLTQPQVDDLTQRLSGLARRFLSGSVASGMLDATQPPPPVAAPPVNVKAAPPAPTSK